MKKVFFTVLTAVILLTGCTTEKEIATTDETTVVSCTETYAINVQETYATEIVTEASSETFPTEILETTECLQELREEGYVSSRSGLNIRKLPGTGYPKVGQLKNGTAVIILERKTVGDSEWGRIDQGWVSMDYIVIGKTPKVEKQDIHGESGSHDIGSTPSDFDAPTVTLPIPTEGENDVDTSSPTAPSTEETVYPDSSEEHTTPDLNQNEDHIETDTNNSDEPEEPAATEHTHNWIPIKNLPAEYTTTEIYYCKCGHECGSLEEWYAHRDGFINSEDIVEHTGWSKDTKKIKTKNEGILWQCEECKLTKTTDFDQNP